MVDLLSPKVHVKREGHTSTKSQDEAKRQNYFIFGLTEAVDMEKIIKKCKVHLDDILRSLFSRLILRNLFNIYLFRSLIEVFTRMTLVYESLLSPQVFCSDFFVGMTHILIL
jgi:hypothetical protein